MDKKLLDRYFNRFGILLWIIIWLVPFQLVITAVGAAAIIDPRVASVPLGGVQHFC